MSKKDDFERVRRPANGRAKVFVPIVELMEQLKTPLDEEKVTVRVVNDAFQDAISKQFVDIAISIEEKEAMFQCIRLVRNLEWLDTQILAVAAYIYINFPNGIEYDPNNDRPDVLNASVMGRKFIDEMTRNYHEKNLDDKMERLPEVKADIITYYYMILHRGDL